MPPNAGCSAIANPNGFEKAKVRWQKYFKIGQISTNSIRSTELSIAYSPCYSIVLMCYNDGAMKSSGLQSEKLSSYDNR